MLEQREDPATILNHDILFITDMVNRFIVEMEKSQSNGISGLTLHDQERQAAYLAALRTKKAWIIDQPLLDLPETHPRQFPLPASPVVKNVDSESINAIIRLYEALRTEMIHSQSARLASMLLPMDAKRFDAIVTKMEKFLTDYIKVATPLDLPESSPAKTLSGPGADGVGV